MRGRAANQQGFSAVELLITLFVAVAFLVAGYQLYFIVIKDNGQTRAQAKAANVAYNYLRNYTASAANPCVAGTPLSNTPVSVSGLSNVTISITVTCPYATSSGTNNATNISRIEAVVNYNSPQQTVRYATLVHDANAPASDITNGLVGWWKLDGNATDSSGSGADGTVTGATLTTGENNLSSAAYSFNASNSDNININTNTTLGNLTSNFTISAWVNVATLSTLRPIIAASRTVTSNGFALSVNSTGYLRFSTYGVKDYDSTSALVPTGSWTFVTASMSSTYATTFYINGVQKDTVFNASGGVANTDDGYHIGASTVNLSSALSSVFDGSIDDVRVYNRVLSAAEINFLYGAGAQ